MVDTRSNGRAAADAQLLNGDGATDVVTYDVEEQLAEDHVKRIPLEAVHMQRTAEAGLDRKPVHFKKWGDDQRFCRAPNFL